MVFPFIKEIVILPFEPVNQVPCNKIRPEYRSTLAMHSDLINTDYEKNVLLLCADGGCDSCQSRSR